MKLFRQTLIAAALALAAAAPAFAQSNPGFVTGQIPSAAQWNSYFSAKQDVNTTLSGISTGTINPNPGTFGDSTHCVTLTASTGGLITGISQSTSCPGSAGVNSFNSRTGVVVPASGDYAVGQVTGAAPLASPTFTGTVTVPNGAVFGTPASINLTNATAYPAANLSGLGTGVATALAAGVSGTGSICLSSGSACGGGGSGNATFSTTSGNVTDHFVTMSNSTTGVKDSGLSAASFATPSQVNIVNGSDPSITATNWGRCDQYTVIASGRIFTLPASSGLVTQNGCLDIDTNGGALTFNVTSPDTVTYNGVTSGAGGSATLPANQFYRVTSDLSGHVYISGRSLLANSNIWTGLQKNCIKTLTISGSTFTPDGSCNNYIINLVHASCPCTLANPSVDLSSTGTASGAGWIRVVQSATGSDAITTWGSNYRIQGGTSAIILSTTANAADMFSMAPISATEDDLVGPSTNLVH